jgi:hypothetical protein
LGEDNFCQVSVQVRWVGEEQVSVNGAVVAFYSQGNFVPTLSERDSGIVTCRSLLPGSDEVIGLMRVENFCPIERELEGCVARETNNGWSG